MSFIHVKNNFYSFDFTGKLVIPKFVDIFKPLFITSNYPINYLIFQIDNEIITKFPLNLCSKLSKSQTANNHLENSYYLIYEIPWSILNLDEIWYLHFSESECIFKIESEYKDLVSVLYAETKILKDLYKNNLLKNKNVYSKVVDFIELNAWLSKNKTNSINLYFYGIVNGIFLDGISLNNIKQIRLYSDNILIKKYDKNIIENKIDKISNNCSYLSFDNQSFVNLDKSHAINFNVKKKIRLEVDIGNIEQDKIKTTITAIIGNKIKSDNIHNKKVYSYDRFGVLLQMCNIKIPNKAIIRPSISEIKQYKLDAHGQIKFKNTNNGIILPLYIISSRQLYNLTYSRLGSVIINFPLELCNNIWFSESGEYKFKKMREKGKYVYKLPWDLFDITKIAIESRNDIATFKIDKEIENDFQVYIMVKHIYKYLDDVHEDSNKFVYYMKPYMKNTIYLTRPIVLSYSYKYINNHIIQLQYRKTNVFKGECIIPLDYLGLTKGLFISGLELSEINSINLQIDGVNIKKYNAYSVLDSIKETLNRHPFNTDSQLYLTKIYNNCLYFGFDNNKFNELKWASSIDLQKNRKKFLIIDSKINKNISICALTYNRMNVYGETVKLKHNVEKLGEFEKYKLIKSYQKLKGESITLGLGSLKNCYVCNSSSKVITNCGHTYCLECMASLVKMSILPECLVCLKYVTQINKINVLI